MSEASNGFEAAISSYIKSESGNNPALSEALKNEKKTVTDCCSFIIGKVKKMGAVALADSEVFAFAKAYYLDAKIEKVAKVNCKVVVGTTEKVPVEKKKKAPENTKQQMSIFDLLES